MTISPKIDGRGDGPWPPRQFDPMFLHHLQELLVLDVPKGLIGPVFDQEPEVGEQLTEAHLGRHLPQDGELLKEFVLCRQGHGSKSPILESPAWARRSVPITSTRTVV